ncbi:hypothetical protein DFH09DRAFT_1300619 [Mycena vulgaris]|nr:hypothetical protein DFH09DRAFT_1300619 [Mycena vulgaris]
MPARRARRSVAIDHSDGEPITRADIQFDFLSHIFADDTLAFSDPDSSTKLSFRDHYVNAILRSPKAKSVLKEKLALPTFATDFAMLALLTNVGRIATTMSFFAEMRTAQRTYHPIPSLQRTNGNLLDAPRIKHILKTSVLEGETKNVLATPAQVLARVKAGQVPPTTLPNLIFVFANHSVQIGQDHLSGMEFLDLFLPNDTSCVSRARAFLWLCYHYHEGPPADDDYDGGANPFSDPGNPGKVPRLVVLTPEQVAGENLDPDEEKALASRLVAQREAIVQDHLLKESVKESKAKAASTPGGTPSPAKPKGKRGANAKAGPSAPLKRKAQAIKEEPDEMRSHASQEAKSGRQRGLYLGRSRSPPLRPIYRQTGHSPLREPPSPAPPPRSFLVPPPEAPLAPLLAVQTQPSADNAATRLARHHGVGPLSPTLMRKRTTRTVRRDHAQRLAVIARLRGKAPTPEPEGLRALPLPLDHWHEDLFP